MSYLVGEAVEPTGNRWEVGNLTGPSHKDKPVLPVCFRRDADGCASGCRRLSFFPRGFASFPTPQG